MPRRIIDVALMRRPAAMVSYVGDAKLPLPVGLMRPALPLTARLMALKNKASRRGRPRRPRRAPGHLDRIDGWIADGVIGAEQPNAADLQIGSAIRLLRSIGDVRPLIEGRPAAQLTRYFPPMAGEIEAGVLPGRVAAAQTAERLSSSRAADTVARADQSPRSDSSFISNRPPRTMRTLDPQSLPQHVDRLYRAAWALCGSREDAEDLVQETFARVLARPRVLRGDDELDYLMRVLRNTFLTTRRTAGAPAGHRGDAR